MTESILIIDGHPDPAPGRLCHALVDAYAAGARDAGHDTEILQLSGMEITFLSSQHEFNHEEPSAEIRRAQAVVEAARHIVIVYPLWLGTMPAKLKAFFEQVFRPGFAFGGDGTSLTHKRLKGRSARVVVTMGMPAFVYRWYFRAHSLKSLERNILRFCGIKPVRETLLGMVDGASDKRRQRWLSDMRKLGARGR